jgi:hypothetical protein
MKVKTILVSQPEPSSEKSPYSRLREKSKLIVDFRPFIHVEGLNGKDVRQQKIDFNNFQWNSFEERMGFSLGEESSSSRWIHECRVEP